MRRFNVAISLDLLWFVCSGLIFFAMVTLPSGAAPVQITDMFLAWIAMALISLFSLLAKKKPGRKSLAAWANAFAITSYLYVFMWDVFWKLPLIGGLANDLWIIVLFFATFIVAKKAQVETGWLTLTMGTIWGILLFQAFHTSMETYEFFSSYIHHVTLVYGGIVGFISLFGLHLLRRPVRSVPQTRTTRPAAPQMPATSSTPRPTPAATTQPRPTVTQPSKPKKGDQSKTQSVKEGSKDNSKINF